MPITKTKRIFVTLTGLGTGIMFDRYAGDNKTQLSVGDKMYFSQADGKTVVMPVTNIMSFLTAQNTPSAPKAIYDTRQYKKIAAALAASVIPMEAEAVFTRDGNPIVFNGFDENGIDKAAGIRIVRHVARLPKGIPNPKERPLLDLPWTLSFSLSVMPNPVLALEDFRTIFGKGGLAVGLGTFRPQYGKFEAEIKTEDYNL